MNNIQSSIDSSTISLSRIGLLILLMLSCVSISLFSRQAQAYTIELSQADLQVMIEQGFPIRQQTPFATTVLSAPQIHIVKGSNRLRLAVAVKALFPGNVTSSGKTEIEGELDYRADKGEFHLRNPVVTSLQFDRLPAQYQELMTTMVGGLIRQTLPVIVVYRLNEKDLSQSMARKVLKGVRVHNGKLIAELDW